MKKDRDFKRLNKEKFLFIETVIRNRRGNVLYHNTSLIPEKHPDYNIEIDRYGLGIKYNKNRNRHETKERNSQKN